MFLIAPAAGWTCEIFGCAKVAACGVTFFITGTALSIPAENIYQLFLTFGIFIGELDQ